MPVTPKEKLTVKEVDILKQRVLAKTTIKDMALRLQVNPQTLSHKLNNFNPLTLSECVAINQILRSI